MNFGSAGNIFYLSILFLLFVPALFFQHFGERKNLTLLLVSIFPAFVGYVWILAGTRSFPEKWLGRCSDLLKRIGSRRLSIFYKKSDSSRSNGVFNSFNFLNVLSNIPFRFWIGFGLLLRILFLFSKPTLSEDVYRFLWDGLLLTQGLSPFSFLPKEFSWIDAPFEIQAASLELLIEMNSLKFYSVYPPILQFLFWISAHVMLFWKSVSTGIFVWKCFLVVSELGILWILLRVFKERKIPFEVSLIYWLNPLALVEISGNAHPESILLFFLIGTVYFAVRWSESNRTLDFFGFGFFFAGAVLTKITPIILVPFFVFVFWNRGKFFVLTAGLLTFAAFCGAVFFIFPEEILKQRTSGLGVFFQLFEFNGGAYYVLREFLRVIGQNFYAAGRICGILTLVAIPLISFRKRRTKSLQETFSTVETIYLIFLLFSTTVHPWYILPLVITSIFSGNIYPIVWSFVIFVSYSTYSAIPFRDSFGWLCFEYGILFLFLHIDYKSRSLQNE